MITEEQLEKVLNKIVDTDVLAAEKKVEVERRKFVMTRVMDAHFISNTGSVEARKAEARDSEKYKQAENQYLDAYLEAEKLNNERKSCALIVEVYRTQSANRRMG